MATGGNEERGRFGLVFRQFKHDASKAVEHLMAVREGEAPAALHHPAVGDIDLVWGEEGSGRGDGWGLAKIARYHPEVLHDLQAYLSGMHVRRQNPNRVRLESDTHEASVRLDLDGEKKTWLLTAYKKNTESSSRGTTNGSENPAVGGAGRPTPPPGDSKGIIDKPAPTVNSQPVRVPRESTDPAMRILSLETATHFGGVACIGPVGERTDGPWASRASSLEVLAAAERLLAECGVERETLDLVVVSTGPGLFTGVRVGLSIAKTLVWAQGPDGPTRLVAVPTLDAVAALAVGQPGVEPGDLIAAVTDARRGEVYAALYAVSAELAAPGVPAAPDANGEPNRTHRTYTTYESDEARECAATPMALVRLAEDLVERPADALRLLLAEATAAEQARRPRHNDCGAGVTPALSDRTIHLIGDGAERYANVLNEALGSRARHCDHRAGNLPLAVARLGLLRAQRGETQPPEAVHPHYVRRPDAVPPTIG